MIYETDYAADRTAYLRCCIVIALGVGSLGWCEQAAVGSEPDAPAFNETAVDWRSDTARLTRGLQQAEAFRRELLNTNVQAVGEMLEVFRLSANMPEQRPSLSDFSVTADDFTRQMSAKQRIRSHDAFEPFSGRWFGEWNKLHVNHNWSEVFRPAALNQAAAKLSLEQGVEAQYAWIGDGFGWNLLVKPKHERGAVVLGYVYHVRAHQPDDIRSEFPLVGYSDGPGRMIWVTPNAFFFEETFNDQGSAPADASPSTYAITGANYTIKQTGATPVGKAFQAVYTRSSTSRPLWMQFDFWEPDR